MLHRIKWEEHNSKRDGKIWWWLYSLVSFVVVYADVCPC